ncbi:hypothetical protein PT2222_100175 [Paraburkholderia tropica]
MFEERVPEGAIPVEELRQLVQQHHRTIAALALGAVERGVGLVDHDLVVARAGPRCGGAHARRDRHDHALHVHGRVADRVADLLGYVQRVVERRARQQQREFLAAEAAEHVLLAHHVGHALRHRAQHRVAGDVAEFVVDLLEVVEIEQQHREVAAITLPAREFLHQARLEEAPVRDAREAVAVGVFAQLGHGVLALALHHAHVRDVGHRDAHGDHLALAHQRHEGAVLLHVVHAARDRPVVIEAEQVGSLLPRAEGEAAELEHAFDLAREPRARQVGKALENRAADHVFGGHAAVVLHEAVPHQHVHVAVEHEQAEAHAFDHEVGQRGRRQRQFRGSHRLCNSASMARLT